jgi:hypothetical protein
MILLFVAAFVLTGLLIRAGRARPARPARTGSWWRRHPIVVVLVLLFGVPPLVRLLVPGDHRMLTALGALAVLAVLAVVVGLPGGLQQRRTQRNR